ncbi:bifunctional diguanylate cyclase/phosphodiesterase [Dactylosporangium sp. NBC_01737]|uniref:putative bifunctional diguanylate cyclase/phosphodiesterase n=1 Tax=Dactylosporangium sp. NBC_01737 TaxID=2975959 RepID=UPI002E15E75B|nr:bifunctional diguanylate cyclase/phosphodiesterase [Dactylosporangium sp. NBC_01737]
MSRVAGWRPTGLLLAAVVVLVLAEAWFAVGLTRPTPQLVSWVAVPLAVGLAVRACWTTSVTAGLAPGARRFWRHIGLGMVFIGLGGASNGVDMILGRAAPQHVSGVTAAVYLMGLVFMLWGLLRIPGAQRSRGEWLRFGLDTATVLVTVITFAWHFVFRHWERWSGGNTAGTWAVLAIVATGSVCVFAFIKVAFTGTGPLDRRALYLLALSGGGGATGGALTPLLTDRPYLNGTPVVLPLTCFILCLAADRQRRAAGVEPAAVVRRNRRPFVPYLAVFATGVLLLADAADDGDDVLGVALGTVVLILLVAARQAAALRDNAVLLDTLDGRLREVVEYQQTLAWQATHDALTGLANRRLLMQYTGEVLDEGGDAVAVALIDVDDFKGINDDLGHAVGDALLSAVAARLSQLRPAGGLVARLGGDEYALVFRADGEQRALQVLAGVTAELRRPLDAAGHALVVEASIGLAMSGDPSPADAGHELVTADELLRRADVAMYEAKAQGKGRRVTYGPSMDQHSAEQARTAADLRIALDTGQLRLHYQPIVRLSDGRTVAVEALVRWQHPQRGMVRPDLFIPAAERTGLIVPVGQWVLTEACRQAARWRDELGTLEYVSVNVSPRQLREAGFAAQVQATLDSAGLEPRHLTVEVTETAVFDGGSGLEELHQLKRLGVNVALDDFGTGHSSLGLLRTCPVDLLKVDKSFIDNITDQGERSVIAEALIGISDGLRLRAVAEGVETEAQAEVLRRLGYRYAQGYHFGRPMPADQLQTHVRAALPAAVA